MSAREIVYAAYTDMELNAISADEAVSSIFAALTSAGYRILAPGELDIREDDIAAAMWKAEAEDSGTPATVARGRTREAFDEQSEELKARWRKFARAAIRNLKDRSAG